MPKQITTNVTFTLRIPAPLRDRAVAAAAAKHVSLNTWLLQLMERAAPKPKDSIEKSS